MSEILNPAFRALATFEQYERGELEPSEALERLGRYIAVLEDQLGPLQGSLEQVRNWISNIVAETGPTVAAGYDMRITAPATVYSFNKDNLKRLCDHYRAEGAGEVATAIEACMVVTTRAGSLRLSKVKQ